MEKTIESIWKEGFLDDEALVAPKVNDLYNQKSEHIIEKFKRMFRLNLKALVAGAILGVIGFALIKLPIVGIGLAIVLTVIVAVNRKLLNRLDQIDNSSNSYEYLKAFDSWMRYQISVNERMAKFYYPAIFLSIAFGFWFSPQGPRIFNAIFGSVETGYAFNGIPALMMIPVALISIGLWFVGDRIYRWDLGVVYGDVLMKLDELLADMEELRAD